MNERIKELAIEANLHAALLLHYWGNVEALTDSEQKDLERIEKFAKLVAADEREACAKLAEMAEPYQAADLIRKRGKHDRL